MTNQLTLNLGVRYDYLDGIPIEPDQPRTSRSCRPPDRRARFAGTLLEDFGKTPQGDRNNIQPRFGAVYDLRGNGRDLIRGGWGIYTDVAYTNSNVLTSTLEGGGIIFSGDCLPTSTPTSYCDPARGFVYLDGTSVRRRRCIRRVDLGGRHRPAGHRARRPARSCRRDCSSRSRIRPTSAGRTSSIAARRSRVDYVRVQGRNLNMRVRPNVDTRSDVGHAAIPEFAGRRRHLSRTRQLPHGGQRGKQRVQRAHLRRAQADVVELRRRRVVHAGEGDERRRHGGGRPAAEPDCRTSTIRSATSSSVRRPASTRVIASRPAASSALPYEFQASATLMFRTALPVTTLRRSGRERRRRERTITRRSRIATPA